MNVRFKTRRLPVVDHGGIEIGYAAERDGAWDFHPRPDAPEWAKSLSAPRGYGRAQDILDDLDWAYRQWIAKDPEAA